MVTKIFIYNAQGTDPHENLAAEKVLMDALAPGEAMLYLWQNLNTVVIGRNQNAWLECRTSLLEEEGGRLARRLSGGGAVYHDLGNLNFTFLMCREDYDLDKQVTVIQKACALAGIRAEKSGRNDLLADGRKFSGNAFYQDKTHAYHHGTLMVDVDKEKLGRYLSPPKAKLQAKGVSSVRSRVVNLKELCPALTIGGMRKNMSDAFQQVYGLTAEPFLLTDSMIAEISRLKEVYAGWDYLYGAPLAFTFSCEEKFDWGYVGLQLEAKNGIIQKVGINTDAMDWTLPDAIVKAWTGCRFDTESMVYALQQAFLPADVCEDLCCLIRKQVL